MPVNIIMQSVIKICYVFVTQPTYLPVMKIILLVNFGIEIIGNSFEKVFFRVLNLQVIIRNG